MLSNLSPAPLDPILSLTVAFRADKREQKMDLGIGVYKNAQGETPIMAAIAQAQRKVMATQQTKAYVGLAGNEQFNSAMMQLVLGDGDSRERAAAVQTPGASGALRMLADLIKQAQPNAKVWLSDPSYVNHQPVMEAAGLDVGFYPYFDTETMQVNEAAMLAFIAQLGPNDIVLLHGCCHNPTGADLSFAAWKAITDMALGNGFTPFVDIAYQGFGDGIEQDAAGLRYMAARVPEMFIATSCSKSFGLYRERTGAAILVAENAKSAQIGKGRILQLARSTYTMPPDHGAALVAEVLSDESLTQVWHTEISQMQQRLVSLRHGLVAEFHQLGTNRFDFIEKHKGMFSHTGLSVEQIDALRQDHGIYMVGDGRINIAGLQEDKLALLAQAIVDVIT
ncbi:aromatic amino acid transaminase [Thaumasiovibrio sp. DFM-14]|uniref:amino acid aminotransferase n=1 Tax=Thaumasiovibrio sp. DFM-14 TaxID=3384792 RepID=UPI0039A2AA86